MTTDRELKTLILDLTLEVKELRMQVRRMEADAERRHRVMMDMIDPAPAETGIPEDVEASLKKWLGDS